MSSAPNLIQPETPRERNWLPMAIAAAIVLVVAGGLILFLSRGKDPVPATPINASPDPYAANLPLSKLDMSESANLAGGKVTYLDGRITNLGSRTVTGITVQILFHSYTHEVAQNETQPVKIIRMTQPYIDVEPVSAAPIKPGDAADFRLIFDTVTPDWDGSYPEIRILRVDFQ